MARYNKARKTWQYTSEFKVGAVQLSLKDVVQVQQVAAKLDIHPFMLSRWRKEYRDGKFLVDQSLKKSDQSEKKQELDRIRQLEKQVAELQQENELLKKWQRFLAEERRNATSSSRESETDTK